MTNQSTSSEMETSLIFGASVPAVTGEENDNDTLFITDNGLETGTITETWKFDAESQTWYQIPTGDTCPGPMTRAALRALRTSGGLSKDCHYVITNPNAQGTLDAQEIILHAVNANTLSMQAGILTSHDTLAWNGTYDIDADDVLEVTDNLENQVISNSSIISFPFGVAAVNGNTVNNRANISYASGNFINNVVESDANLNIAGNVQRNHFEAQSNTTVTGGDFLENTVGQDATVVSSTSRDVDGNTFGNLSNVAISGDATFDDNVVDSDANVVVSSGSVVNSKFEQLSNYTQTGGILRESTVGQDADVTITTADNYENVFGKSTVFRQDGTGYIRYTTIEGTTSWINGDTNISNVDADVATVNTTGSSGTISNSTFKRSLMSAMQNIPSLVISDSTVSNYGSITANGATRVSLSRTTVTDNSRVLVAADTTMELNSTNIDSYGYVQTTEAGGLLRVTYSNISSLGYVRNRTPNSNFVERCEVSSQASVRFEENASNGRVYYCVSSSGAAIYQAGDSVGCYIYYCNANSLSQIYTDDSTNARIYYCGADGYSYIRSINNSATHYMYYCTAHSRGYLQFLNNTGGVRFYSVNATSQSIVEMRNTATGNLYYSTFSAYYYLYLTKTGGTNSGFYGMGRRTHTVTQPAGIAPYATGNSWQNFQ